jgi:hypothetical protein
MSELDKRLRAVCELMVAEVREEAGRHEFDGVIQDLSPGGVRSGLARLGQGGPRADGHDEAHLAAFEDGLRVTFGELELHRSNPLFHLAEMDLACYDKEYAPEAERDAARLAHLALWPDAVDNAVEALDRLSAPVAEALLGAVRGLAGGVPAGAPAEVRERALAAHARLVAHVGKCAEEGDPDAALGADALAGLMGTGDATTVDLGRLAELAAAERDRLMERLRDDCAKIDPGREPLDVCRSLVRDHPHADGVIQAARDWTELAIAFTRERDLVPYHDGECRVDLAPEARRYAMAMMTWAAPGEPDGPSWYHITPPDPSWPDAEAEEWLEIVSATTLPGVTVHEVAPGHFSHGRALRRAPTDVRRTLQSKAFVEGWAHYAEELCVEEGFLADDPRFAVGIWLEALIRVTRLSCAIGVHTGGMTVADAAARFSADTYLAGPAALSEARRATFDPTYGRYTWGKLEILALRERARAEWGAGFSLQRFHKAMLDLGSPPLGLLGAAVERG